MKKAKKRTAKPAKKRPVAKRRPRGAKPATKKRAAPAKRSTPKRRRSTRREPPVPGARRGLRSYTLGELPEDGMGADTGGQSGDIERLTANAGADSQSVRELIEEGQAFEAGVIDGVERAADADQSEVTTREVPEDDVPREYLDQ